LLQEFEFPEPEANVEEGEIPDTPVSDRNSVFDTGSPNYDGAKFTRERTFDPDSPTGCAPPFPMPFTRQNSDEDSPGVARPVPFTRQDTYEESPGVDRPMAVPFTRENTYDPFESLHSKRSSFESVPSQFESVPSQFSSSHSASSARPCAFTWTVKPWGSEQEAARHWRESGIVEVSDLEEGEIRDLPAKWAAAAQAWKGFARAG
jgi:hypothetical protein